MSEKEKKEIREVANVQYNYGWLLENNPDVDQLLSVREERGIEKGIIEDARQMVMEAVQESAPKQVEAARQRVAQITDVAHLRRLVIQILKAPDEATIQNLLKLPSA